MCDTSIGNSWKSPKSHTDPRAPSLGNSEGGIGPCWMGLSGVRQDLKPLTYHRIYLMAAACVVAQSLTHRLAVGLTRSHATSRRRSSPYTGWCPAAALWAGFPTRWTGASRPQCGRAGPGTRYTPHWTRSCTSDAAHGKQSFCSSYRDPHTHTHRKKYWVTTRYAYWVIYSFNTKYKIFFHYVWFSGLDPKCI